MEVWSYPRTTKDASEGLLAVLQERNYKSEEFSLPQYTQIKFTTPYKQSVSYTHLDVYKRQHLFHGAMVLAEHRPLQLRVPVFPVFCPFYPPFNFSCLRRSHSTVYNHLLRCLHLRRLPAGCSVEKFSGVLPSTIFWISQVTYTFCI